MSYTINNYSKTQTITIADNSITTLSAITLLGKDVANYGTYQNENFVYLLENFAGANEPPNPVVGQIWFDTAAGTIRVFGGSDWKAISGVQSAAAQPSSPKTGDLWYDTTNKKLSIWDGLSYAVLGPNFVSGKGKTELSARDVSGHAVLELYSDGLPMMVISRDEFTPGPNTYGAQYPIIKSGINLINTNANGVTTAQRIWGTASDSDRLGGKLASDYILKATTQFDDLTIGADGSLKFLIESSTPTIKNQIGNTLVFKTTSGSTINIPLVLTDNTIVPGTTLTTNIGSSAKKFNTVYANAFNGNATSSDALSVGGVYLTATYDSTPNTIAARDNTGTIKAAIFDGVATKARFADLAEKYLTDVEYDVGTVVEVGGVAEVTASRQGGRAIGVISQYPGYMMNCDLEGGQYVALKGRVPVKVIGSVKKGSRLIASDNGVAIASVSPNSDTFGIALESSDDFNVKLIEAVIL